MSRPLRSLAALAAVGALALAGCASGSDDPAASEELGTEDRPVKIGVVGKSEAYWGAFEEAAEAEDIHIELVDFTEYTQPNPALAAGELDINKFQHILYLADHNEAAGDDLQPIGATEIYPLGLYSDKYDSPEDIPDGETVIVPNDTTNQARGLLVLQSAGLISLDGGGTAFSTLEDIVEEDSRVSVEALDASLVGTSLPDVAAAIINNDFLDNAGLTGEDAIAQDDPSDPDAVPYINIFAVKADDVDNEVLNKLVEIYQTDEKTLELVQESAGGTAVFATNPAEELQEVLADVQADIQSAG
ncbi:MetQ/NlpA family ABC transporter substrate-binding protein [Microbacterium sp. gxy059]|uniref:MetQ/NlpA family ABC transporter substrate-binding protein n=1 Tax=Microbacterium sp. gxy059 TaxID=2957199 RepID=UPI003D98AA69